MNHSLPLFRRSFAGDIAMMVLLKILIGVGAIVAAALWAA
jgi:hypothetical protein